MTEYQDGQTPRRKLRRLQLPEPLGLPEPMHVPDPLALREAWRPPGPLTPPGPLSTPEALQLPNPLRIALDLKPSALLSEMNPSVVPVPPRSIELPGTARTAGVSRSVPTVGPVPLKALPPLPPPTETSGSGRGFTIPAPVWLLAAAALGIAVLSGGHHSPTSPVNPPRVLQAPGLGSPAASPVQSVGMPIPTGDAPVQPIRIVLAISHHQIPARERRVLGAWIERTQNSATRIRIEKDGRLSRPLTGAQWAATSATTTTRGDAMTWLERGVREHQAGALVRIGVSGDSRLLERDIRESEVPATRSVLRLHNKLASALAREIMITSQQGDGGTTAP